MSFSLLHLTPFLICFSKGDSNPLPSVFIPGSLPQVLPVGLLHPILPSHPLLHPEVPLEDLGSWKNQNAGSGKAIVPFHP